MNQPAANVDAPQRGGVRRPSARGPWRRFKLVVRLIVLAAIVAGIMTGCDRMFYYPSKRVWNTPSQFGLPHEEVRFATVDGVELHGWFLPAASVLRDGTRAPGAVRGTVLHFHGNAENVSAHLVLIEWLPRHGYNVLMFDYRGYGQSSGCVTRAGTILDGHAAVDYLLTRPDVDGSRLFAYGQSLGGAIAVVVAAERRELRAVVVESGFASYRGLASQHVPGASIAPWLGRAAAGALVSSGYDPIDVIGRIAPRPVLLIAAEHDRICFPEQSEELYAAAGEPKELWIARGAAHLGILDAAGDELQERVVNWFERARE